jgi:hypothetical protein
MDNVNTVGDGLRDAFSTLINKDGKIFKALVANPDGNGTVESIFNDIETVREKWCNNPDVYNQTGEMLEKTLSLFSFLTRLFRESEKSMKKRHELLFYRGGDTVWGDVWNIRKIFMLYFSTENIWIVNNTNPKTENILEDGDFEAGTAWDIDGCSYDHEACFSERTGIKFDGSGTCRQAAEVNTDSTYFLHFFLRGKLSVCIKDNNNRYWNPGAGEFGEWVSTAIRTEFNAGDWDAKSLYFLTDSMVSHVTVMFIGLQDETAMLDYVRLFLKDAYSSFTLIACFDGIYTEDTLGLAPGRDDPDSTIDYSKMSYMEQSHLFGIEGGMARAELVYTELLEMVRAGGITSYIELLTRELEE